MFNPNKYINKTILITGASSGIGKNVGEYLSKKGHKVIGTSRNPNRQSEDFEIIKLDVTDDNSVDEAFKIIFDRYEKIDVLINNAGFGICGPSESTSIKEAISQFETNYFGVVRVTNKLLPHFRNNKSGLIINMGSLGGLIGLPFQGHYSASKYALEGYTEALRLELLPYKINVCNINPADFKTSFTANRKIIANKEDAYTEKFTQFLKMYENEEENGANPIIIAQLIHKLSQKTKTKVRYIVGKKSQTIGYPIKRLIGSNLFESIMTIMWKAK